MAKSAQPIKKPRKFKLGTMGTLNQVVMNLSRTLRAMADGSLDSQLGSRLCNGMGIMRACLETQALERMEQRINDIADRTADRAPTPSPERNSAGNLAPTLQ